MTRQRLGAESLSLPFGVQSQGPWSFPESRQQKAVAVPAILLPGQH